MAVAHEARIGKGKPVRVIAGFAHLSAEMDRHAPDLNQHAGQAERHRRDTGPARRLIEGEGHSEEHERQDGHEVARTERAVARPVLERAVESEREDRRRESRDRRGPRAPAGRHHAAPARRSEPQQGREPQHSLARRDEQAVEPDQERRRVGGGRGLHAVAGLDRVAEAGPVVEGVTHERQGKPSEHRPRAPWS